MLLVLRGDEQG